MCSKKPKATSAFPILDSPGEGGDLIAPTSASFLLLLQFRGATTITVPMPGTDLEGLRPLLGQSWGYSPQKSLKAPQVVVQRLHICEDTHGIWLAAHHHHVIHLDEALALGQIPRTHNRKATIQPLLCAYYVPV